MTTLLLSVFVLLAPASQPTSQPAGNPDMGKKSVVHRGAPFKLDEQMTMDELTKDPKAYAGKTVKVSGKIATVCKKKGCWLTLAGMDKTSRARITMKDYGFFVPRDSKGHAAIVEGKVEVKTLSEAERKHLADDAGKKVSEIPENELRIVATGVEVRKLGH